MKLNNLNHYESEIIYKCLKCIAEGKVILHDWEFQTIMGIEVDEFLNIFNAWPDIDENDQAVQLAINNGMNNLLGYPHGMHHRWNEIMDVSLEEIEAAYKKWCGGSTGIM